MTINSYDSILAALASGKGQEIQFDKTFTVATVGRAFSAWGVGTIPPLGGYGTSLVMRPCLPTTTGALAFSNPASASDDLYLLSINARSNVATNGTLILYDRVADIGGIALNLSTTNAVTSITLPRYATGEGVQMFMELSLTAGGAPTFFVTYTDQAGNAGAVSATVTCAANSTTQLAYSGPVYVPLAAGDSGVRAVTSVTVVAGSAGIGTLVLAKPLCSIALLTANLINERDLVTQTPKLPVLPDDHCLAFLLYSGTASLGTIQGSLVAVAG